MSSPIFQKAILCNMTWLTATDNVNPSGAGGLSTRAHWINMRGCQELAQAVYLYLVADWGLAAVNDIGRPRVGLGANTYAAKTIANFILDQAEYEGIPLSPCPFGEVAF